MAGMAANIADAAAEPSQWSFAEIMSNYPLEKARADPAPTRGRAA
jgi:hypothetical protein